MIHTYRFRLSAPRSAETAYPLYAALLEHGPKDFAARVHESAVTPVSQHLCGDLWQVSVFGDDAIQNLAPVLEGLREVRLRRERSTLELKLEQIRTVGSVEELLDAPPIRRGSIRLRTPAAFKSGGSYQLLPTQRLMMQSLLLKWNGCFADQCFIEDEGGGLDALAEGLCYRSLELRSAEYAMKRTTIPGVQGTLDFELRHNDFFSRLASALLTFGTCSGLGIKTALGMGGMEITTK